jgi:hypothetical protein
MAWELVSKEDVVSIHPYAEGELKDFWSDVVEGLIREHLSAPNLGKSVVITNETHDGDGTNVLMVRQPPIISVQDIRIQGVSSSASDYVAYDNYVKLKSENFVEGTLNVQIDYTSGNLSVPFQVQLTAAAMIAAVINYRRRYGADSSFKWDAGDIAAGETTPNLNVGLTSHLKAIMKRMLRRYQVRVN